MDKNNSDEINPDENLVRYLTNLPKKDLLLLIKETHCFINDVLKRDKKKLDNQ